MALAVVIFGVRRKGLVLADLPVPPFTHVVGACVGCGDIVA